MKRRLSLFGAYFSDAPPARASMASPPPSENDATSGPQRHTEIIDIPEPLRRFNKKIATLVMLLCISCLKAFPISFVESVPADGSSITSFNFTLVFDISSDIGDDDKSLYGVGWSGSPYSSTKSRTLYRGQPGEGTVLGYALENSVVGNSDSFVCGDSVSFEFVGLSMPVVGEKYYLEITNQFLVQKIGESKTIALLNCRENPLILEFVGGSPDGDALVMTEFSPTSNTNIDILKEVSFTFNSPIEILNPEIGIYDGDELISFGVLSVSEESNCVAIARFDDVKLLKAPPTFTKLFCQQVQ